MASPLFNGAKFDDKLLHPTAVKARRRPKPCCQSALLVFVVVLVPFFAQGACAADVARRTGVAWAAVLVSCRSVRGFRSGDLDEDRDHILNTEPIILAVDAHQHQYEHDLDPRSQRIRAEAEKRLITKAREAEPWFRAYQSSLEARKQDSRFPRTWNFLAAIGGGIGASISGVGLWSLDKDLARRMQVQDEISLFLLSVTYIGVLAAWACLEYRRARNTSTVVFYADPRSFHNTCTEADVDSFIEVFNCAPKNVLLRVAGYSPTYLDAPNSVVWQGTTYVVEFCFSLDLSPWVVPVSGQTVDSRSTMQSCVCNFSGSSGVIGADAVDVSDRARLDEFLATNTNDMSIVEFHKSVNWENWQDLAMNIKLQIRQRGFTGLISIDRAETELMSIYQNTQWANFMYNKMLKVIIALSVVGWLAYVPYMYYRCQRLVVHSAFRVDIEVNDYWQLIASHLTSYGFETIPDARTRPLSQNALVNPDSPEDNENYPNNMEPMPAEGTILSY